MASEHAGGTIVVNCDLLNVRRGAGKGWGVLGTLKRNDTKKVVDSKYEDPNTLWYRIDFEGKEGWVVGTYVKFTPAPGAGRPARGSVSGSGISSRPAVSGASLRPASSGISSRPAVSSGSSRHGSGDK